MVSKKRKAQNSAGRDRFREIADFLPCSGWGGGELPYKPYGMQTEMVERKE